MKAHIFLGLMVLCLMQLALADDPVIDPVVDPVDEPASESEASVFDFTLNKLDFDKGEYLEVTGTADTNVTITILNEGRMVFKRSVLLDGKNFALSHKIDLLDPSGPWEITVGDGNTQITKEVSVSQTRESAFLAVTFLSPTPTFFKRTDSIDIILRITDVGQPVDAALVYFWGIDGGKINIPHRDEAIYSYTYRIPENAELGEWGIKAVSFSRREIASIGGESTINVIIQPIQLAAKDFEPVERDFYFDSPLNLRVGFFYADDTTLMDGNVVAVLSQGIRSWELPMQLDEAGYFFVSIPTSALENKVLNVVVKANDGLGNSSEQFVQFEPQGYLSHFLRKNALFIGLPLIFLIALTVFWYKKSRVFLHKKDLLTGQKKFISLKKKNQQNYFKNRSISRSVFDKNEAEIDIKLRHIELELEKIAEQEASPKQK